MGELKVQVDCTTCNGTGIDRSTIWDKSFTCETCKGRGTVSKTIRVQDEPTSSSSNEGGFGCVLPFVVWFIYAITEYDPEPFWFWIAVVSAVLLFAAQFWWETQ